MRAEQEETPQVRWGTLLKCIETRWLGIGSNRPRSCKAQMTGSSIAKHSTRKINPMTGVPARVQEFNRSPLDRGSSTRTDIL
jgi:hypothetical protein